MGTVTPLVLDKLGINPALAAGPFITTANDLLGLLVYFTVAHFLIFKTKMKVLIIDEMHESITSLLKEAQLRGRIFASN